MKKQFEEIYNDFYFIIFVRKFLFCLKYCSIYWEELSESDTFEIYSSNEY